MRPLCKEVGEIRIYIDEFTLIFAKKYKKENHGNGY